MTIDVLMPALSPTMTEGTVAKWLKKVGDRVAPGDIIAEIETDKATMEIEAVDEGVLGKILASAGSEKVAVNSLIAIILEEGEDSSILQDYQANAIQSVTRSEIIDGSNNSPIPHHLIVSDQQDSVRIIASPLAKRIAGQENIDLKMISGTGPHGRIIKDDILAARNGKISVSKTTPTPIEQVVLISHTNEQYRIEPLSSMRKIIASRLVESKQTIPHFYLSIECNIDNLLSVRAELNQELTMISNGSKLSVNDFIIRASALALKRVPTVNSSWSEEGIKLYNNFDISVAVALDGGLVTPILRNADIKSLSIISSEMRHLIQKARDGKLTPVEYQGGGFSISNLGMYGIKQFSAIINPPQSCILAVGAAVKRPIVANDQISIGSIVEMTLSCDHRVVDGTIGSKFLSALKEYIEHPVKMLL